MAQLEAHRSVDPSIVMISDPLKMDQPVNNYAVMLYILTSLWKIHTTNAGRNMLFHIFCISLFEKDSWKGYSLYIRSKLRMFVLN